MPMSEMPAWMWVLAVGLTLLVGFTYRYRRDLGRPPGSRRATALAIASVAVFAAWVVVGVVMPQVNADSVIGGALLVVVQLCLFGLMVADTYKAAHGGGRHSRPTVE